MTESGLQGERKLRGAPREDSLHFVASCPALLGCRVELIEGRSSGSSTGPSPLFQCPDGCGLDKR